MKPVKSLNTTKPIDITHRQLVVLTLLALLCTAIPSHCLYGREAEWKNLFDGETLNGWVRRGGEANYHVENGTIVGTTVPDSPNTFLCTDQDYGDFILELEFKVDPKLNSGIQVRSRSRKHNDRQIVYGYQVEIDPSGRAWSAGIYDEARRGWLDPLKDNKPAQEAFKQNQWNHYRIEAVGDHIRTWINGIGAADLFDSMTLTGFIGLQVHATAGKQPLRIQWRNIRIKDLGSHLWEPLFDGKTLAGWHQIGGGTWTIENGVLKGACSKDEPRHGLLMSNQQYGDFTARLKFKPIKGNSGFYFRAEPVNEAVGVHGFQAEIDETRHIGGLYETAGRGWVIQPTDDQIKKYFKPGQWNQMTVSAHGRRLVIGVNNHKTAELKDDTGRLRGYLALQLHGGQDMQVSFKDIEILTKKPRKPKPPKPQLSSRLDKKHHRLTVLVDSEPFTCYRYAPDQKYPYFWPVNGPASGLSVTTESAEPWPHHHSLFFACDKVNGGNYWQAGNDQGQILSGMPQITQNTAERVVFTDKCLWQQPGREPVLRDRRLVAITAPTHSLRFIDFEITLTPLTDIHIEKTNHSLFAARVAAELSANAGGTIINAHGQTGEKQTWGNPSPWCDYSSTRAGLTEGIAILQHPDNPWFPCKWFTRDYGFFSPTPMWWLEDGCLDLPRGQDLTLCYRVVVHTGDSQTAGIEKIFQQYTHTTLTASATQP